MLKNINIEKTRLDIESNGFAIIKNIIDKQLIMELRDFWLSKINNQKEYTSFVRGGLVLGEKNFFSFIKNNDWNIYRIFEFPWNKPSSKKTKKLMLKIHKVRNNLQKLDEDYGLLYNEKNYGTYTSVSYYPADSGHFKYHSDGHGDFPILHFMLPLTFKGIDYKNGGLNIETNSGEMINVDELVNPGDLIFFDGRNVHGVDPPFGKGSSNIVFGRLAIFEIPTYFIKDSSLLVLKRSAKMFFQNFFLIRVFRKIYGILINQNKNSSKNTYY